MIHHGDSVRRRALRHAAFDVATVRAMEAPLLRSGVPLMSMAAAAAARVVLALLDDMDVDAHEAGVVLLAGAGDNGGDGLLAGARLLGEGVAVTAVTVGRSAHAAAFSSFVRAGGSVLVLDQASTIPGCASGFGAGEAGERLHTAIGLAQDADVLIDAMTGIGVSGALRGIPAALAKALGRDGGVPDRPAMGDAAHDDDDAPLVVAMDTPSGIGVDDGTLPGAYIPADMTVMCGALKPCAMLPPAAYACGTVYLADFGFDLHGHDPAVRAMDGALAARSLRLPRLQDAKYSRGVTGLITGSTRYPGAGVLTTDAAAHANIGMVRYMGPSRVQDMVLTRVPEAVLGKGRVESWVVGSGVPSAQDLQAHADTQREIITALLAHYDVGEYSTDDPRDADPNDDDADDAGLHDEVPGGDAEDGDAPFANGSAGYAMPPICVDAGALDILPSRVPPQVVITPHAGELAALLSLRGEALSAADVLADPWSWAKRAHEITGATVVLKGAITLVVGDHEDGGVVTLVSGAAPAWLGTAGAGDVLAGTMGALLAQQDGELQEDADACVEAAAAACYIHGRAAALASGSGQRGWSEPTIVRIPVPAPAMNAALSDAGLGVGAVDIDDLSDDDAVDAVGSDMDDDLGMDEVPVGHPIVAHDLIAALPRVVSGLLG